MNERIHTQKMQSSSFKKKTEGIAYQNKDILSRMFDSIVLPLSYKTRKQKTENIRQMLNLALKKKKRRCKSIFDCWPACLWRSVHR